MWLAHLVSFHIKIEKYLVSSSKQRTQHYFLMRGTYPNCFYWCYYISIFVFIWHHWIHIQFTDPSPSLKLFGLSPTNICRCIILWSCAFAPQGPLFYSYLDAWLRVWSQWQSGSSCPSPPETSCHGSSGRSRRWRTLWSCPGWCLDLPAARGRHYKNKNTEPLNRRAFCWLYSKHCKDRGL